MYFVYILSNWDDSVLYIGVTSNLPRRLYEHRNGLADGFTKQYNVHSLSIMNTPMIYTAQFHERSSSKKWTRVKKNALIEKMNPQWIDLSAEWN